EPAGLHPLDHDLREAFRCVAAKGRIGGGDHRVGPESAERLGALHRTGADDERLHRPAEGVGQPPRAGHHLVGDLAQHAVALLQHREHAAHKTLASSRSSRISSGTAAAPSPTIRPSFLSGGGSIASTSMPPGPKVAGFTSSGFFFAAMMPFNAG